MNDSQLPEHVQENRKYWDGMADEWVAAGERLWARESPCWGTWAVPEQELQMLPKDMSGMRAVELGCGTAYVSGWMARRGAQVSGIDNSERQLATARRLAQQHGVELDLHHGNAEATPFPDAAFDFAISEYGAAIWCDPDKWIPEAHRILKPGGQLVFLGNHPLTIVCTPADGSPVSDRLTRSYFDSGLVDWRNVEVDPGGMEFSWPISRWFSLFRRVGFRVENYLEPRPTPGEDERQFSVHRSWAREYPSEQVWVLRKG